MQRHYDKPPPLCIAAAGQVLRLATVHLVVKDLLQRWPSLQRQTALNQYQSCWT